METLFLIGLFLAVPSAIAIGAFYFPRFRPRLGDRRFPSWRALLEAVARTTNLAIVSDEGVPSLHGKLSSGRGAGISWPLQVRDEAWLTLNCSDAVTATIERADMKTKLGRALGLGRSLATGKKSFDAKFQVTGSGEKLPEAATRLHEIEDAFARYHVDRIVVEKGFLRATVKRWSDLEPAYYLRLLDLLGEIASSFDRVTIKVGLLERKAFKSASGALRCSYCHSDVAAFDPDLAACGQCSTVLHESCWAELGRCPVLGCSGDKREKARA